MNLLSKIRGLWRFDGDTEPVRLSRRNFLFLGAATAAAPLLPAVTFEWKALGTAYPTIEVIEGEPAVVAMTYDTFFKASLERYADALNDNFLNYRPSIIALLDGSNPPPPTRECPRGPVKGTPEWYKMRHEWKHKVRY